MKYIGVFFIMNFNENYFTSIPQFKDLPIYMQNAIKKVHPGVQDNTFIHISRANVLDNVITCVAGRYRAKFMFVDQISPICTIFADDLKRKLLLKGIDNDLINIIINALDHALEDKELLSLTTTRLAVKDMANQRIKTANQLINKEEEIRNVFLDVIFMRNNKGNKIYPLDFVCVGNNDEPNVFTFKEFMTYFNTFTYDYINGLHFGPLKMEVVKKSNQALIYFYWPSIEKDLFTIIYKIKTYIFGI